MRSVGMGMVQHDRHDPAVEAVTGQFFQYAAERWGATDPGTSPGTHFSPCVSVDASFSARDAIACDGRWHQQVRGPISVMLCSTGRHQSHVALVRRRDSHTPLRRVAAFANPEIAAARRKVEA